MIICFAEIKNDITRETPARPVRDFRARFTALARSLSHGASFEPTIDYVVTKIPRFAFEKFPRAGVAALGRKPPFELLRSKVCGALPSRRYG